MHSIKEKEQIEMKREIKEACNGAGCEQWEKQHGRHRMGHTWDIKFQFITLGIKIYNAVHKCIEYHPMKRFFSTCWMICILYIK